MYIIRNNAGRLYIGMSEDVLTRVVDHNSGVSRWTKHRGPWELIWQSEPQDITSARKLENLLKRQKGGAGLPKRASNTFVPIANLRYRSMRSDFKVRARHRTPESGGSRAHSKDASHPGVVSKIARSTCLRPPTSEVPRYPAGVALGR